MTPSGPVLSLPLRRLGNMAISPWISLFVFVTGGTGRVTAMSESLFGAPSPYGLGLFMCFPPGCLLAAVP